MTKIMTSKGRMLDMSALVQANANTIAMGNARMNARGDRLDMNGNIVKSAEAITSEYNSVNPNAVRMVGLNSLVDDFSSSVQSQKDDFHTIPNGLNNPNAKIKATGKVRNSRKLNHDKE